jgi:tRNA dimethylallyltransferase
LIVAAGVAARPLALVLTGPTGSGKSALALQLARQLPLEIVSVDSAQVYRGMDIGTAKPAAAERASVPHHLLDIRDPAERYSAGDFVRDAVTVMTEIHTRGRVPLLVGGTMLYLRALLQGMAELPPASVTVRAAIDAEAAVVGWTVMHRQLQSIDPQAAARINPNDPQRIQRALEVERLTGRPLSEWQRDTAAAGSAFRWLRVALIPADRVRHRQLLAERFDAMMRAGLPAEVRQLYERGDLDSQLPAIRAVGYRQLWAWCAGRQSLEAAAAAAIVATAQLAKRQLTWLRADPELKRFDAVESASRIQLTELVTKTIESR